MVMHVLLPVVQFATMQVKIQLRIPWEVCVFAAGSEDINQPPGTGNGVVVAMDGFLAVIGWYMSCIMTFMWTQRWSRHPGDIFSDASR